MSFFSFFPKPVYFRLQKMIKKSDVALDERIGDCLFGVTLNKKRDMF